MFLEHANLTVTDLERSISFYSNILEWEIRWRGLTNAGLPAAHVGNERCYLALFQAGETESRNQLDYAKAGLNHIGFVVEDLENTRDRLIQNGTTPHHEADYHPGTRLCFLDPDGIEIELVQYKPAPDQAAAEEQVL